MTVSALVGAQGAGLWRATQRIAVAATFALIAGLFLAPKVALGVLWDLAIPLVPASLLISPALWRNVCPLATLSMLPNGLAGRRIPGKRLAAAATTAGMLLLAILVPARRFLFNADGTALAVTVLAVAVLALVLGASFEAKAGFCNGVCPVLPVERLYGQHPLIDVGNPRCAPCTLCATGCLDIAPKKSITAVLGPARRTRAWVTTPYGAFAAAFPGFVLGYYLLENVPLRAAGTVYLEVVLWAGASYLVTLAAASAFDLRAANTIRGLGAAAAGIYYWFASAVIASWVGAGDAGTLVLRVGMLVLVAGWYWNARRAAVANGSQAP